MLKKCLLYIIEILSDKVADLFIALKIVTTVDRYNLKKVQLNICHYLILCS